MAATDTPMNTYKTFLMVSDDGNEWGKLIDVKSIPDLGSAPPTLDTTTLSDKMHTYINDILDTGGGLEFTANYTPKDYNDLKKIEGVNKHFGIWIGGTETAGVLTPDGSLGKWNFQGSLTVYKSGAEVGAVQDMGLSIAPGTVIEWVPPASLTA